MRKIIYSLVLLAFACTSVPRIIAIDDRTSDIEVAKLTTLLSGTWELESMDLYSDSTQIVPFIFDGYKMSILCDSLRKILPKHKPVSKINLTYVGDNLLEVYKQFYCDGVTSEQALWVVKVTGISQYNNWQTSQLFSIVEYDRNMIVTNVYRIEFFNIDAPAPSGEVVVQFQRQLWMDVSYTTEQNKPYHHQIKLKKLV